MGRRQAGAVDRLPSGRWRARYRGPDGHRHSAVFQAKGDADAWLADQRANMRRGSWSDPRLGRITVADWSATWLETTIHLKPSTRAGYESKLRTHILPRIGPRPIADLDKPAVRRFLAELVGDGLSPGSILGVRAVLRLVFETAREGGALTANPCAGVKVPRPKKPEMHFLTAEEVEALAEGITRPSLKVAGHGAVPHWRTERPELGLLVRFAAYTGLRAGEIAALRVRRVDLLRSTVEVAESATEVNGQLVFGETKNYQRRTVPLPEFLRDDLAAHLKGRPYRPEDPLFSSPEGGPFRHNNFYRRQFKPAVAKARLPATLRFHDLRHTYASFLIAQGAHPRAIMERMGHSSVEVTLGTYGHILPEIDERLTTGLDGVGRAAREGRAPVNGPSGPSPVGSRLGHAGITPLPHAGQK
jgi:integrase